MRKKFKSEIFQGQAKSQAGMTRREFLRSAGAAASAAAVTALAAACAPGASPTVAPSSSAAIVPATAVPTLALTGKAGGSLIWALNQAPNNLIPFGGVSVGNQSGKEFMYDSLLAWDRDLNIIPALAERYETPDDKTYVFYLKKGVKFHDGTELTADAVKYSMALQAAPPEPGIKIPQYPAIVSVDIVDPYTVKFNMKNADPTFPGYLAWSRYSSIVPVDMYKKVDPLTEGIGTGPFQLVEFVQNDRVVYKKNPAFWRQGLPYLDNLTLQVIPDEQEAVAALRAGHIHGMTVSPETARALANDANIVVLKGLTSTPNQLQLTIQGDDKPWNKKAVRQAMNLALDRAAIIEKVFAGEAVLSGPIPPGYGDWFISPDELAATFYKPDVERAKQLMRDAGFENGFDITLYSIAKPSPTTSIAEIVKQQLAQININVTVQAEELAAFAQRNSEGRFDFCSTTRGLRSDPAAYLIDYGHPVSGVQGMWFSHGAGWKNEEAVANYNALLTTMDSAKRHQQARRIQEIALDECPHFTLCQAYKFQAVRKEVREMFVDFTDFNRGLRTAWLG